MTESAPSRPVYKRSAGDVNAEIVRQVEFYFSNSNLPRDSFLKGLYDSNDGWVPVDTIASFKKMQSLTQDINVVKAALKTSTFLKLNEDQTQVTRVEALPAVEDLQAIKSHILYISGLPSDATLEEIQAFFEPANSKLKLDDKPVEVKCVRMSRDKERNFRGQIFVEVDSEAVAKRVAEELNGKVKFVEGEEFPQLTILTRDQYFKLKKEEEEKDENKKEKKGKKRKAEGEAEEGEENAEGKSDKKRGDKQEKKEMTADRVLRLSVLGEGTSRESIKAYIEVLGGKAAWVEYNQGDEKALIRLHDDSPLGAAGIVAAKEANAEAKLNDTVPTAEAVTGEDEKAYWDEYFAKQGTQQKGRGRHGGGRRGGRGGRGGKRQRN